MSTGSLNDKTPRYIVAGNGPSLAQTPAGTARPQDFVIRVNNFFLEPRPFLGTRVDLAFMGGDPFVAPLMFESLRRRCPPYDLRSWSTHNSKIAHIGMRRIGGQYHTMAYRDAQTETAVRDLITGYQKHPMTGTYAVLMAHGLGAQEIVLTGFDFYQSQPRYCFQPGAKMRALLGPDIGTRGVDEGLHDPNLDLEILKMLKDRGDVRLWCASANAHLRDVTEQKPDPPAPEIAQPMTEYDLSNRDWVSRSGLCHASMLQSLLLGRRCLRIVTGY